MTLLRPAAAPTMAQVWSPPNGSPRPGRLTCGFAWHLLCGHGDHPAAGREFRLAFCALRVGEVTRCSVYWVISVPWGAMGEPERPVDAGSGTTAAKATDADTESGRELGLGSATALVIGNIVGTGIFLLPASMAAFGTVSLVAMGLVTLGAIAMAMVFGKLGARIPAGGGPYAYARDAFGEFVGFWNAWSFWLTAWIGTAAIAVAWVGYVQYFVDRAFGLSWGSTFAAIIIPLVGVWIPAFINMAGAKNMAA